MPLCPQGRDWASCPDCQHPDPSHQHPKSVDEMIEGLDADMDPVRKSERYNHGD